MSTNALEDGEIASEHDSLPPSPQNATFGDLNDEKTIDKMIEESNGSAPKEAVNKSERKPLQQQQQNKERRARKRYTQRSTKSTSSSTSTTRQNHISRDATSMSSWQKSGSNERMRRPPPSDAVMFPPPPNIQPLNSINCNPDIVRLQSLVNHGNFFPPPPLPSQQVCYFPSPASIYPHIPPLLSPAAPNCSYRGGNYEEVGMEISDDRRTPEEPPSNFFNDSSAAPPPVQIPLNTLLPPPPPPPILPPLRVERAELKDSVNEEEPDADALRQLLLDQMSQNKKRVAPDSSGGKSNSPVKKQKKSSSVSASATPLAPLPPAVPPAPAAEAPATPSPKPTPSVPHPESRQSTPTSTSTNAKSKTKTRPQTPVDSPASPTPSEHAPLRALEIPVLSPKASRESQSGKQKELDSRIRDLTEFIKDSQSKMRKEHEEMKSIMEKYNVLKASMGKRRDEIKGAHAEKRELQNQLEALEFEELDNLFDDIEFVSIVQKVAPTPVALKNVKTEFSPNVVKCEPKPKKETFIVHPHPQKAKKLVSPKIHIQIPPEEDSVGQSDNDGDDDAENSSQATGADFDEEREEVNYEEEEEEEENIEVIVHAEPNSSNTSFISACINSSANYNKSGNVPQSGLNAELSLREKLLAKCGKSRQSPDVSAVVSSSSPDRAESSRNFLLKICKFDLNGTCTRGRDCTYLHLIDVNDGNQQRQLLESVLRDVLGYKEVDIGSSHWRLTFSSPTRGKLAFSHTFHPKNVSFSEPAIDDVVQFLPRFREFEKLIHHFLNIVMQRNPEFRNRLFEFFATGR